VTLEHRGNVTAVSPSRTRDLVDPRGAVDGATTQRLIGEITE